MNVLHRVSDFVLQNLSEKNFRAIRSSYLYARRQIAPLTRQIYGSFNTNQLRDHLEQRIGHDFEILMVHGSVNHMFPTYTGNALELVNMLIDYCGSEHTLAMPAFFFGNTEVGSVQQAFEKSPYFHLKKTPSQMGLFTELFRRSRGVVQSRHPVYRVSALGPLADQLTHRIDGPDTPPAGLGKGSPFEFMAEHKTTILGIGKSYHVMTQTHHVDELLGENFPAPRCPIGQRSLLNVTVIDADEEFPVSLRGSGFKWRFNIDKLPSLLRAEDMDVWKFHNVPLFSANAKQITDRLVSEASKGRSLYDPA